MWCCLTKSIFGHFESLVHYKKTQVHCTLYIGLVQQLWQRASSPLPNHLIWNHTLQWFLYPDLIYITLLYWYSELIMMMIMDLMYSWLHGIFQELWKNMGLSAWLKVVYFGLGLSFLPLLTAAKRALEVLTSVIIWHSHGLD